MSARLFERDVADLLLRRTWGRPVPFRITTMARAAGGFRAYLITRRDDGTESQALDTEPERTRAAARRHLAVALLSAQRLGDPCRPRWWPFDPPPHARCAPTLDHADG